MENIIPEEKIKAAAREIFTSKGYGSARMRDIASKAGVNLALVNYYFRSKENLFNIIMKEKVYKIFGSIFPLLNDNSTSLEEKLYNVVSFYIDIISEDPDLPLFVFGEIEKNPHNLSSMFPLNRNNYMDIAILKQFKEKCPDLNPVHFMINLLGMIIFPFVAKPLLKSIGIIDKERFKLIMEERKKMIPVWIQKCFQDQAIL